jgi:hypothetical protein
MENIQDLSLILNAINTLDTFFEYSDSNVKWELENRKLENIKTFLRVNENTREEIKKGLNNIGKINYARYLNGNPKLV